MPPKPNQLWVVDLTYVPTWQTMAFTAFVTDVFSRRVVGWRTATRMPVQLPLDALEMALWVRDRDGHADPGGRLNGLVHHSDYAESCVMPRNVGIAFAGRGCLTESSA
jgi:putative transposase